MLQSFSDFISTLMTFLLTLLLVCYWEFSEKELPDIRDTVIPEKVKFWSLLHLDNLKILGSFIFSKKFWTFTSCFSLVFLSTILFFIYQMFTVFILSSNVKKKKGITKWTRVFIQKSKNPEIFFRVCLVWHSGEKLQVSVVGDLWPRSWKTHSFF